MALHFSRLALAAEGAMLLSCADILSSIRVLSGSAEWRASDTRQNDDRRQAASGACSLAAFQS